MLYLADDGSYSRHMGYSSGGIYIFLNSFHCCWTVGPPFVCRVLWYCTDHLFTSGNDIQTKVNFDFIAFSHSREVVSPSVSVKNLL